MNCLRFSGSPRSETCSAETVVPRMTKRSTPASTTVLRELLRCAAGDSAPATVTPASRISASRCGDQLGLDRLGVDLLHPAGRASPRRARAISASSGSGSSYRVHRPSRLSTPRPPSWPSAIAVAGDIDASPSARRAPGARTGRRRSARRSRPPRGRGCAGSGRSRCRRRRTRRRPRLPPADLDLGHVELASARRLRTRPAARRSAGLVVRRLDGHLDVVRVALLEPGRRDPDELAALPAAPGWCARRRRTSTAAGRRPAGARRRRAGRGRHLALDALGDQLVVGGHVGLEVAVLGVRLLLPARLPSRRASPCRGTT